MRKTIDLLARKQYEKALARALAGAKESPAEPKRQALLLFALSKVDRSSFPAMQAAMLLRAFIGSSDLSGALGVIGAFRECDLMPDDGLLREFLDAFATQGDGAPPMNAAAEPDYGDLDAQEGDVVAQAVQLLESNPPPMLPPAPPRGVPLFRALDEHELATLFASSRLRVHGEGDHVIHEGDDSDSIFVLLHGQLKVLKGGDTDKYLLGRLRPGSFFGEMALVTSSPRTASVLAESPSVTMEIPSSVFEELVVNNADLARELTMYTRVRLLKNLMKMSPLFSPIPAEKRPEVIQAFRARVFDPGDTIVKEGSPSQGLFMVASGEVYIERNRQGEHLRVATLGPGEVFGEMSLIRGGNATADVIAGEDGAVVMFLSRESFNDIVSTVPELLSHVFQTALVRSDMNESVEESEPEEPVI